jgi:hypothetical protein
MSSQTGRRSKGPEGPRVQGSGPEGPKGPVQGSWRRCRLRPTRFAFVAFALGAACIHARGLDPRIPIDGPRGAQYTTPHIEIDDNGIRLQTLNHPSGYRMTTADGLRRLLLSLPISDRPNGRHMGIGLPSVGTHGPLTDLYLRRAIETLGGLGVDVQIISTPFGKDRSSAE